MSETAEYVEQASNLLLQAPASSEKSVVFGPENSESLTELAPLANVVMDPWSEVLEGGQLEPAKMFTMFREQVAAAHAEGYQSLRVMADMDWTAAARPSTDEIVGFELLLGALVRELDASIICAYRRSSFTPDMTTAMLSVHEIEAGGEGSPQFKMYAADGGSWRLSGEIDVAVASTFETGIAHTTRAGDCTIDVSSLEYIDVAGMRQIAEAGRAASGQPIRLLGASPMFRRMWSLAGFPTAAPSVEFVDEKPQSTSG